MYGVEVNGTALRELRYRLRANAAEFAAWIGVATGHVYRIESETCSTSFRTLDRIAATCGVQEAAALIVNDGDRRTFLALYEDRDEITS